MEYIERYWRDATPQDAIAEPPMVARFKTDDPGPVRYIIDKLVGVIRTNAWMWRTATGGYLHCQVYDAPDPGEGWRLIDTANEKWQEGDEIYEHSTGTWRKRLAPFQDWALSVNRRRIEQPKPEPKYVPFTWEDREQLRGRWIVDRTGEQEYTIDDFLNDSGILYICGHPAEHFLNWTFLDTGEPVGKRVL